MTTHNELWTEYLSREKLMSGGGEISDRCHAWMWEPLTQMLDMPARCLNDLALKVLAHARLLGISSQDDCQNPAEWAAVKDALALAA